MCIRSTLLPRFALIPSSRFIPSAQLTRLGLTIRTLLLSLIFFMVLITRVVDCPSALMTMNPLTVPFLGLSDSSRRESGGAFAQIELNLRTAWAGGLHSLHRGRFPGLPLHDGSSYQTTLRFLLWSFIHDVRLFEPQEQEQGQLCFCVVQRQEFWQC